MAGIAVETKTNGEFIEMLLETEASMAADAKTSLNDFLSFRAWLQLPVTSESVESIAEVFSARVHAPLKSLQCFDALYREKLKNVREFLRTMRRMASSEFGIEANMDEADSILGQT